MEEHDLQGVSEMWVKPEFEVIEVCAEVTAYAYQK
ncbi:pyrroloquinoline quinone precursor peptide PqqA [Paenibacillus albilobatus]